MSFIISSCGDSASVRMILDRSCRACARQAVSVRAVSSVAGPSRTPTGSQAIRHRQASTSTSSSPSLSGSSGHRTPLKVAIIGSGPSAFYAASRLLQLLPQESDLGRELQVHMYERLPTPYGLVRYGVAPDHPEVKVSLLLVSSSTIGRESEVESTSRG